MIPHKNQKDAHSEGNLEVSRSATNPEELPSGPPPEAAGTTPPPEAAGTTPSPEAAASGQPQTRTAWHPMFFQLVKRYLPTRFDALEEFYLSQLPHRIDVVIIRRDPDAAAFRPQGLEAVFNRFQDARVKHALLELKAPNDAFSRDDAFLFLGHANLYAAYNRLESSGEVVLITISDGLSAPFRAQVERMGGKFCEVSGEPGVWEVGGLAFGLWCVDVDVASQSPGNHLLYTFTRRFMREPGSVRALLTEEEERFFLYLCQQVVQLRGRENVDLLRDYEMLTEITDEALVSIVRDLPLKTRLAGLTAEERLRGLDPEERLRGLDPEERLRGLDPEERLRGLDPGEVLQSFAPEERLRGLDPEAVLKGLDPETRARLKRLL